MTNKQNDTKVIVNREIGRNTISNPKPTNIQIANESLGGKTKTNVSISTPKKGK